MDESYEAIRAFALQQLASIDQRLDQALIRLRLLLSAAELSSSDGLYDEFDRLIDSVQDELKAIDRNFVRGSLIETQVAAVVEKANLILTLALEAMGIDPHGPGLSERMEVRKAVTRSKTKTEQVRDLAKFTQKLGGKIGAAGDLTVQVTLMIEVGRWLIRSWKAKKRN